MNLYYKNKQKGFSLIDSIIAISIMSLVFFGIFGVFKLSIDVLSNNKARVGAISLANEQMEFVRSLSYDDVGTLNGIPSGNIPQSEEISLNGIKYNRRTLIQYIDDAKDGKEDSDENGITADYKKVKIEVSWQDKRNRTKFFSLISNIVPKGIETTAGGGTILINVFDAMGVPIQGAQVNIVNNEILPSVNLNVFTNLEGKVIFPGSPSANNYKITVTKDGYSTAKTYGVDALNVNPSPGNLSVLEGDLTTASFPIDLVSKKTIKTFFAVKNENWEDLFDDLTKISTTTNTEIINGSLDLLFDNGSYKYAGFAFSNNINPSYLKKWDEFYWDDISPLNTGIAYQIYYSDDTVNYNLIPDSDLAGNSSGLTSSPVDLSGLDISNYNDLRLSAVLSTTDASTTPSVLSWGISYQSGPTPFPNVSFHMEGDKTIGSDSSNNPIKKYSENLQTGVSGELILNSLEWDNYLVTVDGDSLGYDISESCPPQPVSLEPNTDVTTKIILSPHTSNSLLVSISDSGGNLLNGATVKLYRDGFEETKIVESCGQVFFDSLSVGSVGSGNAYSLDVTLTGFENSTTSDINISGTVKNNIILESL